MFVALALIVAIQGAIVMSEYIVKHYGEKMKGAKVLEPAQLSLLLFVQN